MYTWAGEHSGERPRLRGAVSPLPDSFHKMEYPEHEPRALGHGARHSFTVAVAESQDEPNNEDRASRPALLVAVCLCTCDRVGVDAVTLRKTGESARGAGEQAAIRRAVREAPYCCCAQGVRPVQNKPINQEAACRKH